MKWEELDPLRFSRIDAKNGTVASIEPLPWDKDTFGAVVENMEKDKRFTRLFKSISHAKAWCEQGMKEISNGDSVNK